MPQRRRCRPRQRSVMIPTSSYLASQDTSTSITSAGWRDRSLAKKRTRPPTIWMLHQCCDKIELNLGEQHRTSSAPDMNTHSPERFERRRGDGNWTHNMTAARKL